MRHSQRSSRKTLAIVYILPLIPIIIYCLGANSKWIGVRELRVRVIGVPVNNLTNARLYECFGTEEAVLTSKTPDTDFRSIDFVTDGNTNELISRLTVTGEDYLVDWFDRTKSADYVLLEYEDPLNHQTQRAVFRTPAESSKVTSEFTPNSP